MDVFIVNPLMRQKAPSAFVSIGRCHAGSRSPLQRMARCRFEPYQLISQYTLEPLLKLLLKACEGGCPLWMRIDQLFRKTAAGVDAGRQGYGW